VAEAPKPPAPEPNTPADVPSPASSGAAPVASSDAVPNPAGPFLIDELVDVAPAGPATANEHGVVLVTKSDTLVTAARGPLSHAKEPAATPVASLDRERHEFAPYGRGPAVAGSFAYWVSQGRLVRRKLDGSGELEVLAPDARQGTRVAAVSSGGTAVAAYVSRSPAPDEPPRARVWVEGNKRYELTPDGSGASSVALTRQGDNFLFMALDGRSGMTPLHARRLRLAPGKKELVLGPDQVVWVGGGSQPTTEIAATTLGEEAWAFVAIERDVTHFGLAQIRIGREPQLDSPATFVPYPNGINTSPVASARVCGRQALVFARPSTAQPFAPQELVLAELGPQGLSAGDVVVRAKAFADASLSAVEGGALLAYTADHRTWAASIRCRR
jgi:hypothetical protein